MTFVSLTQARTDNSTTQVDLELDEIRQLAGDARGRIDSALVLAVRLGSIAPYLGSGHTRELWELLATIGSVDLTVARVIEPHLDALSILRAADLALPGAEGSTWGVFAAEGPGLTLTARHEHGHWTLSGQKPWCSLAAHLDFALITAHTSEDQRRLFAVNLRDTGVSVASGEWAARGLAAVESGPISLDDVEATPVGADGWYLERPGFSWGGIGVAAIWYGASVALGRQLRSALGSRQPDQIGLMILGEVDLELHQARALLLAASAEVDQGCTNPIILAQRVRSSVSRSAERVSQALGHALGPGPLATDEEHARRVADLALYIRQDHAERDLVRLGNAILELDESPW